MRRDGRCASGSSAPEGGPSGFQAPDAPFDVPSAGCATAVLETTRTAACIYAIPSGGPAITPGLANVAVMDQGGAEHTIPYDPTYGWTFDDPSAPTEVIFNGLECSDLESTPARSVEIILGCATITR